jgi:hypothetical protein
LIQFWLAAWQRFLLLLQIVHVCAFQFPNKLLENPSAVVQTFLRGK